MLRFFCCFWWLFYAAIACGQTIDTAALAQAERDLARAETLYSKEHIEYQNALLKLAAINLQSDMADWKWEDDARATLLFIREQLGPNDSLYIQGLAQLPLVLSAITHAEFNLADAKKTEGQRSASYVRAFFRLARAHQYNDEEDWYPQAVEAFRWLHQLPMAEQEAIRAEAATFLPKLLWFAEQKVYTDEQLAIEPPTLATADTLIAFAKNSILFFDELESFIYEDSTYWYISYALELYQAKLGKEHPLYKAAYQTFTPEMEAFYVEEQRYLNKWIHPHKTNLPGFLQATHDLIQFWDDSEFIPYSEMHIFNWGFNDIEKYHGGKETKLYQAFLDLRWNWDNQSIDNQIEVGIEQVEELEDEDQTNQVVYWDAVMNLANLYIKDDQDDEAYEHLETLFERVREGEIEGDTGDSTLPDRYLYRLNEKWQPLFKGWITLQDAAETYGPLSSEYWTLYFQLAWVHVDKEILYYERGIYRMNDGLRQIPPSLLPIAYPYLQKALAKDHLTNVEELRTVIAHRIPVDTIKALVAAPIATLAEKYTPNSWHYAQAHEVIADAYFLDTSQQVHADQALNLYKYILRGYLNDNALDDYVYLLNKITRNIRHAYNPWTADDSEYFLELLLNHYYEQVQLTPEAVLFLARYGDWYYNNNQFVSAERYLQEVIDYYNHNKKNKQKNLKTYLKTKYKLARTLRKTGRYELAVELYLQLLRESAAAHEFLLTIRASDDLGLLLQSRGRYEEAIRSFDIALEQLQALDAVFPKLSRYRSRESALLYTKILRHKGRVYLDQGYLEEARNFYEKVRRFEEEAKSPVSFEKDVSLIADLATLAKLEYEYDTAAYYYQLALSSLEDYEDLAQTHLEFATYYQSLDEDSLAARQMSQALAIDLRRVQNNYTQLSEKERLLFLEPIAKRVNQFLTFATSYDSTSILIEAFNAHLVIKGLALETSTNLQSICNATENVVLRNQCLEMQSLRQTLASTALPLDEQHQLERELVRLEKEIGRSSDELRAIYQRNNRNVDFHQLKQLLYNRSTQTERAFAIDFLIVPEVTNRLGDLEDAYYAVVVAPKQKHPIFIRLASAQELSWVLAAEVTPNTLNYITDKVESAYLYQLVWEPLLPYIDSAEVLHLCPTGILSKVAFGTLVPDAYGRQRVMDKWSIHYHGALRDLLELKLDKGLPATGSIALVGGVKFSLSNKEFQRLAARENVVLPPLKLDDRLPSLPSTNRAQGSDFSYLPGTLSEVQAISQLFPSSWVVQLLSDTLATEKNLSDIANASPNVVHIATHGYFFPKMKEKTSTKLQTRPSVQHRIARSNNPLIRSGLALTNINRIWNGGPEIEGLGDGIWTALEVSNLDLFNTQLVVLSACETGRGDIDNHEGVMGLRRAFRTAGAQQLIISLWKVPDQQTAELMQLFYTEYLRGQSAHQAFALAQTIMRQRYPNPYYWAAFLLIE